MKRSYCMMIFAILLTTGSACTLPASSGGGTAPAAHSMVSSMSLSAGGATPSVMPIALDTPFSAHIGVNYAFGYVDTAYYGLPETGIDYSQFTTFSSFAVRDKDEVFTSSHVLDSGQKISGQLVVQITGLNAKNIVTLKVTTPFAISSGAVSQLDSINWNEISHTCIQGLSSCGVMLEIPVDSWFQKTLPAGVYRVTAEYQDGSSQTLTFHVKSDSSGAGLGMIF